MNKKAIKIQDTTLRDGEQTPGIAFNLNEKVKIFNILEKIGVDCIEVGFPGASTEEENIIKKICKKIKKNKTTICVFSRILESDILTAAKVTENIENVKIQLVAPVSDLQIRYSINKSKNEILNQTIESLNLARKYFSEIQFTAQDATRANQTYLNKVLKAAVKNGATTLCLPDTTGFSTPNEYSCLIKNVKNLFKYKKEIYVSAHCHNDLGLATANALAAIYAGADQIECTLGGFGERAGNTPLEEIIAILDLKEKKKLPRTINLSMLSEAKNILEKISKVKVHKNKPIFGSNVFSHASGMHQKAILENRKSFEILEAEKFGFKGGIISFGKLSGKAALKKMFLENNSEISHDQLSEIMPILKKEAEKKKILNFKDVTKLINKLKK